MAGGIPAAREVHMQMAIMAIIDSTFSRGNASVVLILMSSR